MGTCRAPPHCGEWDRKWVAQLTSPTELAGTCRPGLGISCSNLWLHEGAGQQHWTFHLRGLGQSCLSLAASLPLPGHRGSGLVFGLPWGPSSYCHCLLTSACLGLPAPH